MELEQMLELLNGDLCNEYKHMLFYMHSANMLTGLDRLYLAEKLKEEASSEMQHVYQFAHKIRGWGGKPVTGLAAHSFPILGGGKAIIDYAIEMEQEVVANYHTRHAQAEELTAATGKYMDIVLFLEEQIEHSQKDIDEFRQIQMQWK